MKKILTMMLVFLLLIAVAGCGSKATTETSSAASVEASSAAETSKEATTSESTNWVIGFNNYSDSHEFCKKVHDSITAAAEQYGVTLLYAEAQMDGTTMIANTEQFIMQGANLIIDFNWIPEIGKTMVEKATEAGVKFISMDTVYEGGWYFGANSYNAGKVLGEYLAQRVVSDWGGQLDAIVGCWYQGGGDIVKDRVVGAVDALKAASGVTMPADDMIYEVDAGASDQAVTLKTYAQDFLTAHPDLHHVIFLANNDESGAGLFAGVQLAGREADCFIGTTGGDTPFQDHIRAGGGDCWVGSTSFAPEKYGEYVIPMAVDILEGKDVPLMAYMEHFVITAENIDEYYPAS
jgi:ribose transport system substrate-binding protein